MRVVLLASSPRVAPGILSAAAWAAATAGPVFMADAASPHAKALVDAGVDVRGLGHIDDLSATVVAIADAAGETGTATVWIGGGSEPALDGLADALVERGVSVEPATGSWDLPGARLLDVVTTMDRLRSPGGCPWDQAQDHASLAPYLLEEAYETFQSIEDGDSVALREELGDVLLQIAFHARLAEELDGSDRWTIDDVADGLVAKLTRRHPHVFGDVDAATPDQVNANWEAIKTVERGGASPLASVPMAAPALTLAATLQRKAARAGLADPAEHAEAGDAFEAFTRNPDGESAGALLWSLVELMRHHEIDPEAALRQRAKQFRDTVGEQA